MKQNNQSVQETEHDLLWPVIPRLRQTVRSDVCFTNKSFFWTASVQWTGWISSSNQTEASETVCSSSSTDLQVTHSMSQNSGESDPVMNEAPAPLVSRRQAFWLAAEGLEPMAAFIAKPRPWGRVTDMSNNQSQFVSFSAMFPGVEMSSQKQTGVWNSRMYFKDYMLWTFNISYFRKSSV